MSLLLSQEKPFARGGNRLCFLHPSNPLQCIKVRRPDFSLEDLRRSKRFPKNLRPLSAFDDNLEEYRVICKLLEEKGEGVFAHIYRCYGFIDTDLGPGLVTELIRDADGLISISLKEYIWLEGLNKSCREALNTLTQFWLDHLIPSRDLLTHNVVVQLDERKNVKRLVVIDGLGSSFVIPDNLLPIGYRRKRLLRRIERFEERIDMFLDRCQQGIKPSRVGMLMHRG